MSKRRKQALSITAILAALPLLIGSLIQLDRWRIERRQTIAQATYREQVERCEAEGGQWARGDCVSQN